MARILIAEDDASMLRFLKLSLEKTGHTIIARPDGLTALAALDKDGPFDLLLTDIVMPGMDGVELAEKAAKQNPEMKVVFITGFSGMAAEQKRTGLGDNARLLSKPFHLNDLAAQIEEILQADSSRKPKNT